MRRTRRILGVFGLLGIALLSGCVYLRLLELKKQMAAFDQNFAVETTDGVRIICRHPVLLADDVRWIGLTPEASRKLGNAEQWQVRWVKQRPPALQESGAFDILVELLFSEGKLTRVAIPERYFALMPKALLLDMLRSLGGAKVDRASKAVEAQLAAARPNLPAIEKLLGVPTGHRSENGQVILQYRYLPAGGGALARAAVFDMTLYFNPMTGSLDRWSGKTPVGRIGFNFQNPSNPPAPN